MNDFTTEIVQTLVTKGDLNELFRSHLEKAINTLLRTELTAFLDYEKYDRTGFNSGNSRNGSYFRSIKTEYGELTLEIPRDRNGEFKQQTLPAYKRTNDTLETTVFLSGSGFRISAFFSSEIIFADLFFEIGLRLTTGSSSGSSS